MGSMKKLPSIYRVAIRRAEIAHALNLEDESEITAATEELSHVLHSALLVLRQVDRLPRRPSSVKRCNVLPRRPIPPSRCLINRTRV